MPRFTSISLLCAMVLLTIAPRPSHATPPPTPMAQPSDADIERARELFENGKSLYLDGSYEPAIAAFKQAYGLSGDPLLLYNTAQAYDRGLRYDEAIEYFEYYRAFAPASEREALEEKVQSLRKRKLKAQANAPANQPTPPFTAPRTAEPASPNPAPASVIAPPGPAIEPDREPHVRLFGPVAGALSGVAVVGIATGVGLGVASRQRSRTAQSMCAQASVLCSTEAQPDITASRRLALGADLAFGFGAAAAAATIVIIAVHATRRAKMSRSPAQARLPGLGPSARGGGTINIRF